MFVNTEYPPYIDSCQWEVSVARGKAIEVVSDDVCCPSVVESLLDEDEATELARILAALADPVRLRLFSMVAAQGEVCSCDLEGPLGRSQPTVSHHTKLLAQAGLIRGEKRGRWVWWSIVPGRLTALRKALGE
jgi:ArsR family transcriptional regulator